MSARIVATLSFPLLILSLAACAGEPDSFDGGDSADGIRVAGETGEANLGDGDGDPDLCEVEEFSLASVTPNVMLVLDKSGSMNDNRWDDDGDETTPEVTRWHSLHGVVANVTDSYQGAMNFGVTLFPAIDAQYHGGNFASSCKVAEVPDLAVGPHDSATILAALPSADDEDFGGATPATEGILTALAHLEGLASAEPSAMVLITDGAANCADQQNIISAYDEALPEAVADAWSGAGIPTYVVGIDIGEDGGPVDVNPRVALHQVALAGGVANDGEVGFYDATDPAALGVALDEITARLSCQVDLAFTAQAGLSIIVEVDGVQIPQVESCADTSEAAWVQIDPTNNPNKIELCNAACADAELAGGQATMCPVVP